jgi:plasmid stabilization system protein ParE
VTEYRLVSEPQADFDIEATFHWYENERAGLGLEFLHEISTTYDRIVDGPLKYQELRSGIHRALVKRFPYAVYFAVEVDVVIVLAVLHASRDPAEWPTTHRLTDRFSPIA